MNQASFEDQKGAYLTDIFKENRWLAANDLKIISIALRKIFSLVNLPLITFLYGLSMNPKLLVFE